MKILVVEDDRLLNETLSYNLRQDGYEVCSIYNKKQAIERIDTDTFALVILDINLPDGDGYEVCAHVKKHTKSLVIFLTAKDLESDQIWGYEMGADDYVTKPFSIRVFQKKVAAMLKSEVKNENVYEDTFFKIDFDKGMSWLDGQAITFTKSEYKLLQVLIGNQGAVMTRKVLLDKMWDQDGNFVDEHTLTTLVSRLRAKINSDEHPYIKTVYGMGYMWAGEKEW